MDKSDVICVRCHQPFPPHDGNPYVDVCRDCLEAEMKAKIEAETKPVDRTQPYWWLRSREGIRTCMEGNPKFGNRKSSMSELWNAALAA